MLFHRQFKQVIGLVLLGLVAPISPNAQELQLWKVSEQVPVFYQEACESSQKLAKLKPGQATIILVEQKNWIRLINLDTKEIGWIKHTTLDPRLVINLQLDQAPNSYGYYLKVQNSKGTQISRGYGTRRINSYSGFRKAKSLASLIKSRIQEQVKELEDMEETFDYTMTQVKSPVSNIQPIVVVSPKKIDESAQQPLKVVTTLDKPTETIAPASVKASDNFNTEEGQ